MAAFSIDTEQTRNRASNHSPGDDVPAGRSFFPSYNPLEDDPWPPHPRRHRIARQAARIAVAAAWRTALFVVGAIALYYLFLAHGWHAEVIR